MFHEHAATSDPDLQPDGGGTGLALYSGGEGLQTEREIVRQIARTEQTRVRDEIRRGAGLALEKGLQHPAPSLGSGQSSPSPKRCQVRSCSEGQTASHRKSQGCRR